MTDAEFEEWLFDTSRNPFRVLLIDMHHRTGIVRLGSQAWMSEFYEAYDDWLLTRPATTGSISNFLGVGAVDAVNRDDEYDWSSLEFGGQFSRWYFGDIDWPKSAFRQIATTLIESCRNLTERRYRFDLMDSGQELRRTYVDTEITRTESAQAAIDRIMSDANLAPVTYVNVPASRLAWQVTYTATPRSLADKDIRTIARSIDAYIRRTQFGEVEVYVPAPLTSPSITLTEDSIGYRGVEVSEVQPAYRRVTVELADGSTVSAPTNADTGRLNQTLTVKTLLASSSDATTLLNDLVAYHSTTREVWRIPAYDKAQLIQEGDVIGLDHFQITGTGLVESVRRTPLDDFTNVEVRI